MNQLRPAMNLSFMLCCCLAFVLLVHGQAQSGFISIDCGIPEGSNYTDEVTNISYTSDARYVDTGTNYNISPYYELAGKPRLSNLRSFPEGIKNCYTIKPEQANGNKYLIRALFKYGNYDSKNEPPEFDLYLDGDRWDTIKFKDASELVWREIIHVPATAYIHVCLVNTSSGTPFISALELRPLDNSIYPTKKSGSLKLVNRIDAGATTNDTVRYPDDVYDRFWVPDTRRGFTNQSWERIQAPDNRSGILSSTDYKPPSSVMATAVKPVNGSNSLNFSFDLDDWSQQPYVYMHFVEIETVEDYRVFDNFLNGVLLNSDIVLDRARSYTTFPVTQVRKLNFSLRATEKSTLPPILNAIEVY